MASTGRLRRLFDELSDHRLIYRKIVHTPRLAVLLHTVDKAAAQLIVNLISDVFT
jgi:hypothetical protein